MKEGKLERCYQIFQTDDTLRLSAEILSKENLYRFFDLVKTVDSEEIIAEEIKKMLDSPEEKEMALIAPELHRQIVLEKRGLHLASANRDVSDFVSFTLYRK